MRLENPRPVDLRIPKEYRIQLIYIQHMATRQITTREGVHVSRSLRFPILLLAILYASLSILTVQIHVFVIPFARLIFLFILFH